MGPQSTNTLSLYHHQPDKKISFAEMVGFDRSLPFNTRRYHRNREDGTLSPTIGSALSSSSRPSSSSKSTSTVSTRLSPMKLPSGSPMLRSGGKPRIFVQCCRGLFNLT